MAVAAVEQLLRDRWLLVAAGLLLYALVAAATRRSKVPNNLPWVGKGFGGPFAERIASFNSLFHVKSWLAEGYEKYSEKDKTYIFPDPAGNNEVVLPNSKLRWLIDQPDHISNAAAAHYEQLCGEYAFTDPYILGTSYHEAVIHKNLARRLNTLIPDTWDELKHCFDSGWGTDTTQARDIGVFDSMIDMISKVSNRIFVGYPLCRDQAFVDNMGKFANDAIQCAYIYNLLPAFLRPIIVPFAAIPNHLHYRKSAKQTIPIIKQRLIDMELKDKDPNAQVEIPEDYFTWHIRLARAEGKKKELDPVMISKFLLAIEFAAIHTTTLTVVNILFDLIGSDPKRGFIEGIREEAERVFKESGGQWTKQALNKLVRADSAIRESMRVSNFLTRGVPRMVVNKAGLTNEEEGWTAPHGAFIVLDVHSRHHDPKYYPNPEDFDAFRFSRPREEYEAKHPSDKGSEEYLRLQNTSITSTSENFLAFGHGRHACPGRFLVSVELKMLLAYMVMNYEVDYLPSRPPNFWFGQNVLPPMKETIRIKRRQGTV